MSYFLSQGGTAYRISASNKRGRWSSLVQDGQNAIGGDFYAPVIHPKFSFKTKPTIFAMGSCFAQELSAFLVDKQFDVSSWVHGEDAKPYLMQKEGADFHFWPAHFFHRYNTHSMLQEFKNLFGCLDLKDELLFQTRDGVIDAHYHQNFPVSDMATAIERRAYVKQKHQRINECNLVVLTLGLTETWLDRNSNLYSNTPIPYAIAAKNPEQFSFFVARWRQVYENLSEIIRLIHQSLPDSKIIITTSPIPLDATFTPSDILVANTRSKSTLRCAAEEIASEYDFVDYFPSYEIVMGSARSSAWRDDQRHVATDFVGKIMELFCNEYFNK